MHNKRQFKAIYFRTHSGGTENIYRLLYDEDRHEFTLENMKTAEKHLLDPTISAHGELEVGLPFNFQLLNGKKGATSRVTQIVAVKDDDAVTETLGGVIKENLPYNNIIESFNHQNVGPNTEVIENPNRPVPQKIVLLSGLSMVGLQIGDGSFALKRVFGSTYDCSGATYTHVFFRTRSGDIYCFSRQHYCGGAAATDGNAYVIAANHPQERRLEMHQIRDLEIKIGEPFEYVKSRTSEVTEIVAANFDEIAEPDQLRELSMSSQNTIFQELWTRVEGQRVA